MDSTLITVETLDEIADIAGIKAQVAPITEAAMNGEIDFRESFSRRVALFEGLNQSVLQQVYDERVKLTQGAERFIATLQQNGIKTMLISSGFEFFTERLKARLGLDYAASNRVEIKNGKLTGQVLGEILDAQGKADWLNTIRSELGLQKEQVMAVGDGANDLKMMAEAGVSIAYNAKPLVSKQATYSLNHAGLDNIIHLIASPHSKSQQ